MHDLLLLVLIIVSGVVANTTYYLLPFSLTGHLIFYSFSGLSISALFPLSIKLLCHYWVTDIRKMAATCLILSVTLTLCVFLFLQSTMIIFTQMIFCTIVGCLLFEISVIKSDEKRDREDSGFEIRVTWRTRTAVATMNLAGMYVGVYLIYTNDFRSIILALMAFIAAASLILLDSFYKTGYSEEGRLSKIVAPLMASLILFIFVDGIGRAICCFIVLFCYGINIVLSAASTIIRIRKSNMSHVWPSASHGASSAFGALIGAVVGISSFQYLGDDNIYLALATSALFVFIVIWFFTLFARNEYPVDADGVEEDMPKPRIGSKSFVSACSRIGERYNLTARKKDVLLHLARGRGSKHISEDLCISQTTAKTHIYQIYKTLGVGSREEIIDLVEKEANSLH
jgi:DNA-binding CsgD family transcriptional regulator/multisubunit Na+/H+ antiporter MnhC subunit